MSDGVKASLDRAKIFDRVFEETIRIHQRVREQSSAALSSAVDAIQQAWAHDGKVLLFGNGGSAADAQHLAAELVGRFNRERKALAALALSVDTSVITAVANDAGYERIFSRQLEALGRRGDVAFAITTSGTSRNVTLALERARQLGLTTIVLTGRSGGTAGSLADVHINVPGSSAARIQEAHRTLLHVICEILEAELIRD